MDELVEIGELMYALQENPNIPLAQNERDYLLGLIRADVMHEPMGDPRFEVTHEYQMEQARAFFAKATTLMQRKSKDYGDSEDSLKNFRHTDNPQYSVVLRMGDKMSRITKYVKGGEMEVDGHIDDLMDIANYAAILFVMLKAAADYQMTQI